MNKLFITCCLLLLTATVQAQLPAPEYQKGIATLNGKIENYDPNSNLTFIVGVPNVILRNADNQFPTIEADGSFQLKVVVYHSTQLLLSVGKFRQRALVAPGKETSVIINLANQPGKQFIYSGEYATINNELSQPELKQKSPAFAFYAGAKILDEIGTMNANQFKEYLIKEYNKDIAHNNAQQQFGEAARTLANLSCAYGYIEMLQAAPYILQMAYQKKNNATRNQAAAAFMNTPLPKDFYDCLNLFPVNHPMALYCFDYITVSVTFYETDTNPLRLYEYLEEHAPLSVEEQITIQKYRVSMKAAVPFKEHNDLTALCVKHKDIADQYRWEGISTAIQNLSRIMQDSTCLFVDHMRSFYPRFNLMDYKPMTTHQQGVVANISHPVLLGILQDMNEQMQPRRIIPKKKFTVCEAPQVPEKELLSAIIARHKGKVQFIDFWATWCGGCRQTIKEYEPLKKEMTEDKVAFVYLTGPSSTEKTWNILISDIEGEHYWLNKEQWNHLWNDFQMQGLPMYLLIDKQGNIVKKFTHITAKELKDLLQQETNK